MFILRNSVRPGGTDMTRVARAGLSSISLMSQTDMTNFGSKAGVPETGAEANAIS